MMFTSEFYHFVGVSVQLPNPQPRRLRSALPRQVRLETLSHPCLTLRERRVWAGVFTCAVPLVWHELIVKV